MTRRALLLAASVLYAGPAWAVVDPPAASKADLRMRTVVYNRNNPVQVSAAPGASLRIELGDDERVVSIVVSDQATIAPEDEPPAPTPGVAGASFTSGAASTATAPTTGHVGSCDANICRTVAGNFVYIKPLRDLDPQPFFIQTSRVNEAGVTEMVPYTFELLTRPGDLRATTPNTTWGVAFVYPERVRAAHIIAARKSAAAAAQAARERAALAPAPMPIAAVAPATSNIRYAYRGSAQEKPDGVSDDGRTTLLRFNGNRRIPNFYRTLPDGKPSIPAYAVEPDPLGNTVRIAHTDTHWWFRDGDEVGCLFNVGTDPHGATVPTIALPTQAGAVQ